MERETGGSDTLADGDDRELRYRSTFDPDTGPSLLRLVTEGLADLLGDDPHTLEPPLATVAAWEALERLVEQHVGETPAPIHYVEFAYQQYVVTVHGDGTVCIHEPTE